MNDELFNTLLDNLIAINKFIAKTMDVHGVQFHTISAYIMRHHSEFQQVESPQDELLQRLQSKFENPTSSSQEDS